MKEIIEVNAVHGLYDEKQEYVGEEEALAIKKSIHVLNIGCGNAVINEEMYDEGYLNITNNDISSICIRNMKKRN